MKRPLGTLAATVLTALAVAPFALGAEQTRESYKAQVEPICQANREVNERIMRGARQRVNHDQLVPVSKQFVRLSGSFGDLIAQLEAVPPPVGDEHRVERWFDSMSLLRDRLRLVGKYYKAGEKIKGTHEAILAERSSLSANNTSIVFHFHYCRFGHISGT
jgi:hypothetical protein